MCRTRTSTSRGPGAGRSTSLDIDNLDRSGGAGLHGFHCRHGNARFLARGAGWCRGPGGDEGPLGPLRAAQEETGACPERDDTHSGAGQERLRAMEREAGGHGDEEVEQEQGREHLPGGEQRLHGSFLSVCGVRADDRGGWGQIPACAPAVRLPRLVIRAIAAPASATAAATRKALCIPAANVAWLMWVMALASWGGVPRVTGATPTETALLTWASWVVVRAGRCAACQLAGSRLSIFAVMMAPRMAVPKVPPSCMAVDCSPPATPASWAGALPTMTSVAPTITGARPRPSSTNQMMVSFGLEAAPRRDRPNIATAAMAMPAVIGRRGPVLLMRVPAMGEPTMSMAVIGSRCTPAAMGLRPCTFSRKKVMKNMAPNRANMSRMTSTTPAETDAERNSFSGSIGWRARDSRRTNASPSSAAAPRKPRVRAEPQPQSGPLIRPKISADSAPDRAAMPGMSNEPAGAAGVSFSTSRLMARAAAPTGTLT